MIHSIYSPDLLVSICSDDWARHGNYAEYLNATRRVDTYLGRLWNSVQSLPEYKDKTTLIFSPDHGRGELSDWKNHGEKVPILLR
jgi:arylsulfatase A-like enzyme